MATTSSPFTKTVTSAMRKLYPEHLADRSFDNTGLLLEAPENKTANLRNSVLLTIDLTKAVAQEAIEKGCGVVVAYHPIIFRPLKALTLGNTQQSSLLRLAAEGISVYCPHTAVDAAVGGNADWLADIVTLALAQDARGIERTSEQGRLDKYIFHEFGSGHTMSSPRGMHARGMDHERQPIIPSSSDPQAGIGRIVRFPGGRPASDVIGDMLVYLLQPQSVNIAIPQDRNDMQGMTVRSIGICAGSGGSVFKDLDDVEMLITGEMSHHEALAATENGKVVLCLGHSNSERQYLQDVMKPRLKEELGEGLAEADVEVSVQDRDPFLALVRDADRN